MTPEIAGRPEFGRDFVNFSLNVLFYLFCAPMIGAAHVLDTVFSTRSFERLVRLVEVIDNGHHAP